MKNLVKFVVATHKTVSGMNAVPVFSEMLVSFLSIALQVVYTIPLF